MACAELLKALSDLNHQQINALNESRAFFSRNAILNEGDIATVQTREKCQNDDAMIESSNCEKKGEMDWQHQKQQPLQQQTVTADTEPRHSEDNGEAEQNRLHREIENALRDKRVKSKKIIALFEQAKSTNNLHAIDDIQLSKIVFFLSRNNSSYALEVLKMLESSLDEVYGTVVSLQLYRYIRDGLVNTNSPELIEELTNHIKETYPEGSKRVIYQQIILPEIALALSKHKNPAMKACAMSVMGYVLEKCFPVDLNADVYMEFLERAEFGQCTKDSPFHRLFTQLVTNGKSNVDGSEFVAPFSGSHTILLHLPSSQATDRIQVVL